MYIFHSKKEILFFMVAQKGHTCKLKMLLQIKNSTCKLKIVLQIENRKPIEAN